MFKVYYGESVNEKFFNLRIDIKNKQYYIDKYNLKNKGKSKDYFYNNIKINCLNNQFEFRKYISKNVIIKDKYLIEEFDEKCFNNFNFFNVDYEEEYNLYCNIKGEEKILLKDFNEYITLEMITDNLNELLMK
tara:strand:+ start:65 stop:463 length:399 start_codon:yes stop_codon:yes gene_type:complete